MKKNKISLADEDGTQTEFELLDLFTCKKNLCAVCLPEGANTVSIFKIRDIGNGMVEFFPPEPDEQQTIFMRFRRRNWFRFDFVS